MFRGMFGLYSKVKQTMFRGMFGLYSKDKQEMLRGMFGAYSKGPWCVYKTFMQISVLKFITYTSTDVVNTLILKFNLFMCKCMYVLPIGRHLN